MLSSAPSSFDSWAFDVSSLMVLISEGEELKYRLSGRCFAEAVAAVPMTGIQSYLRSYNILLEPSQLTYYSPYGCKQAPLRNMKLDNVIAKKGLLEDGMCTVLKIRPQKNSSYHAAKAFTWVWTGTTWIVTSAALAGAILSKRATWIGCANSAILIGWSIFVRTLEHFKIKPATVSRDLISSPDKPDAVVFLGRSNSCLIIEGSREEIKKWTSNGLVYKDGWVPPYVWQYFTRSVTFLVLLMIFATIPNGSTMDQILFILLNILGQANTMVGLWINANYSYERLEIVTDQDDPNVDVTRGKKMKSRTHVYAEILRRFKHIEDRSWVDKLAFLPQTRIWTEWKDAILDGNTEDAKDLYEKICINEKKGVSP